MFQEYNENLHWSDCIASLVVQPEGSKRAIELNPRLIDKQGLDVSQIKRIMLLHEDKIRFMDKMDVLDDVRQLKYYASMIEEIEFYLQGFWGFPHDANYHRWWNVPKCSCPAMDNEDMYGTEYNVYNESCPIHGSGKPSLKMTITLGYELG